ncbi:hypothetical protein [Cupriavidus pauculus]|uniref:hypothetical protein n=1 Tax=Cupriavidus pauculus TaxID=82633 RepID=UPI001FD1E891|nr:hypothetical protein [Cupriavidus pauculus]
MAADAPPACRLDNAYAPMVKSAIDRAAAAYKQHGRSLPFQAVSVNDVGSSSAGLRVYIIKDSSKDATSPSSCKLRAPTKDDELDALSVRGGCVLTSADAMEIRCSAQATRIFSDTGNKLNRESPALLYVLAHELGHLYQRESGDYSGRAEVIDLKADRAAKLAQLQSSCDPASVNREREADELALDVLKLNLGKPPYRESTFSERGSVYWNIDLLALASDKWQAASLQREFVSRPKLHPSFEPTEFPTPPETVRKNARRFVCDVLSKKNGRILYPGKSTTHPPVEQRMRRIAEVLRPVAASLPDSGGSAQFASIARLQSDLSPIFTQIYRETGVYMEAEHNEVCSIVNAPTPPSCK